MEIEIASWKDFVEVNMPSDDEIKRMLLRFLEEGSSRPPDGCPVEPYALCPHGHRSWLLELLKSHGREVRS